MCSHKASIYVPRASEGIVDSIVKFTISLRHLSQGWRHRRPLEEALVTVKPKNSINVTIIRRHTKALFSFQKFSRFSVTSNFWTHAWSIKYSLKNNQLHSLVVNNEMNLLRLIGPL